MALVAYASSSSSSSDSESPSQRPSLKRKRSGDVQSSQKRSSGSLPPLPAAFRDLYATAARVTTLDDPALHGGRKRTVPHVEGNWPTHVYLEWCPTEREAESLQALIDDVQNFLPRQSAESKVKLHSSVKSDLGPPLPLHISLSCPLLLRTEQREDFEKELRKAIKTYATQHGPFEVTASRLDWVVNAEKTRWFLALKIAKPPGDDLNRLLDACNRVARASRFPALYDRNSSESKSGKPSTKPMDGLESHPEASGARRNGGDDRTECFHFSIAWTVDQPQSTGQQKSSPDAKRTLVEEILRFRVAFDAIKLKMGNTVTTVPLLRSNEKSDKGILG